jgi:nucleoside-diphosphate-sugar epimerase
MHVFVTGGSGLTGPAIVEELITAGHTVTGLARSDESAARLQALGARVRRGALEDAGSLRAGAEAADGVIHMAFGGSFSDPEDLVRRDVAAIEALGQGLTGSGKPFVSTSGTFVMAAGRVSVETRTAGRSAYPGDGANRWPAVHRLDAARLFRLALEQAPAGSALHGAGECAVTLETIAHQIGAILRVPVVALDEEQFAGHLGNPFLARCFATDAPASSALTRDLLGWAPAYPTLLEDLATGDYFAA